MKVAMSKWLAVWMEIQRTSHEESKLISDEDSKLAARSPTQRSYACLESFYYLKPFKGYNI